MRQLAIVLAFIAAGASAQGRGEVALEMVVEQSIASNPLLLTIKVTNKLHRPIELPRFKLPWGNRHSMVIVGIEAAGTGDPLPTTHFVSVPGPGRISIQPAETMSGEIDLTYYISNIREELSHKDILVFWLYRLRAIDPQFDSEYVGTVVLSRNPTRRQ
jgi:hypothetical protein